MNLLAELRQTDLKALDQASPNIRSLVIAVLALMILAAGYALKIKPQRTALTAQQASASTLSAQLSDAHATVAGLPEMERQVRELQTGDTVLPLTGGVEMTGLLDSIARRAGALGIITELFEPGPEPMEVEPLDFPYAERAVKLRMRGGYHAFGRFAAELAALEHPVVLREFALAPAGEGTLSLEGELRVLRELSGPDVIPVVRAHTADEAPAMVYAAAELPDPFAVADQAVAVPALPMPDAHRERGHLERFELSALTLAGTVATQTARWALIIDADGRVHRVAPGDRLGPDHGRVMRVGDDRVEIEERVPDGAGGWRRRQAVIERRGE